MYDSVVSLNSENGTKVAKPARNFVIPITTLTTVSKNKDKLFAHIFFRVVASGGASGARPPI